ncbi:hypothetical protein [Lysinibacillus sp. G4S2]|uniref:hypothetical protein n=1 Tax=Lysinibacillus sp. G4S2 TaxID=3055859 RepID=UPI0025A1EA2B|nr:hypothetical protein [Lysinibacillus sp. G4S2]MDM5245898.1 hypothetical protein [Lysinibacillus sp. G4S2]
MKTISVQGIACLTFSGGSFIPRRKRSDSNTVFVCAKAKRQQHGFCLCESEATATRFLSVRKRSDSYKCFISAKAKRQQQSAQPERKSTPRFAEEPYFI